MRTGVKVNRNRNVRQVLRTNIRRVGTDKYGLTNDRSSLADNQATTNAIRCASDLTPFTTTMELSLALLEKNMVICRFYFVGLPCAVWKPLELCFSLWRAHKLNLKIFGSEQALVSGNQPREREDGAPSDIANNFSTQWSTPAVSVPNSFGYAYSRELKAIAPY